jgi:hypothetical protein
MQDAPPVFSGVRTICGTLPREDAHRLAENFLANTRYPAHPQRQSLEAESGPPAGQSTHWSVWPTQPVVRTVSLAGDDAHLAALSKQNVWALTPAEIRVIRAWFERPEVRSVRLAHGLPANPTDVENGMHRA